MPRPSWMIRPMGERDADAVVELLAAVAREGRYIATEWPFDVEARSRVLREALLTRYCVGWIALDGRSVVGQLSVFELHHEEPELGMVIAADYRRRGIGAALLNAAIAWARTNGKPAILLRVFPDNDAARALYRGAGFVDVEHQRGAIARRDGSRLDVIVMRRALAENHAG